MIELVNGETGSLDSSSYIFLVKTFFFAEPSVGL